jgi:hypothetical protein
MPIIGILFFMYFDFLLSFENFFVHLDFIPSSHAEILVNNSINNLDVLDSYGLEFSSNETRDEIDDFTLLIYMIGSDLETQTHEASKDINEMTKRNIPHNSKVNIVLETGGSTGKPDGKNRTIDFSVVQRHKIEGNTTILLDNSSGKRNMGEAKTLSDFLKWGISSFPAKKYGLIFWDHGSGVEGFGRDENFGNDKLYLSEIFGAFYETNYLLSTEVPPNRNFQGFEFIGFDSCLMATMEVASFFSYFNPYGKFLIASQEIEPDWGWNYSTIVNSLSSNPDISGDMLGKNIIDSYIKDSDRISKEKKFNSNRDITLSVINLTGIRELHQEFNEVINSAIIQLKSPKDIMKLLRAIDLTDSFGLTVTKSFGTIDMYDFLSNLENAFPSLKNKIYQVKDKLNSVIRYNHSGEAHPNAKGLSIFLPTSRSEFEIVNTVFKNGHSKDLTLFAPPVVTLDTNWLKFIHLIGIMPTIDKFSPAIQSSRNEDGIIAYVSDPDLKRIFSNNIIKSSKGDDILYIQNLDHTLLDETGIFKYNGSKMLGLCDENENTCSPVTMTMEVLRDLKKFFIPVKISTNDGNSKYLTLIYEYQNNNFYFLGGIEEEKFTGNLAGSAVPKEKIELKEGDVIAPIGYITGDRGYSYVDSPYYISNETTTIVEKINKIFDFADRNLKFDKSLLVTDPSKIKPKFININQSDFSMIFCDFADHCDKTRTYQIDNTVKKTTEPKEQKKDVLFFINDNSSNSNNLKYVNQKYGFQLEYPSNWFSVVLDANTAKQFRIHQNDPDILLLYPEEEILNSNGTQYSLRNVITASVTEGGQKDLKRYYKFFTNPVNLWDIESSSKETKRIFKGLSAGDPGNETVNGYPAFEFILKYQTHNLITNITEPVRYEYWITISANEREYTFKFSTEQDKFEGNLHKAKEIISSFKPFNKNEIKQSNELMDKESDITKIREIMAGKTIDNIIWKNYTDHKSNFSLLYPYIDKTNNPIKYTISNDWTITHFTLPSIHFLDLPYLSGFLTISLGKDINDRVPGNYIFNYKLHTSEVITDVLGAVRDDLKDCSNNVKESTYFLPFKFQTMYQKEASFSVNDKILKIGMEVPNQDKSVYEPIFDKIVDSYC